MSTSMPTPMKTTNKTSSSATSAETVASALYHHSSNHNHHYHSRSSHSNTHSNYSNSHSHTHTALNPKASKAIPPPPSSSLPRRDRSPRRHQLKTKTPTVSNATTDSDDTHLHSPKYYEKTLKTVTPSTLNSSKDYSFTDDDIEFDHLNHHTHFYSNSNGNRNSNDYRKHEHSYKHSNDTQSQQYPSKSFFSNSTRKSAIQDVIKKFQCPDTTSIPTTIMSSKVKSMSFANANNANNVSFCSNSSSVSGSPNHKQKSSFMESDHSQPYQQQQQQHHHHPYHNKSKTKSWSSILDVSNDIMDEQQHERKSLHYNGIHDNTTSQDHYNTKRRPLSKSPPRTYLPPLSSSPKSSPLKQLLNNSIQVCQGTEQSSDPNQQQHEPPTQNAKLNISLSSNNNDNQNNSFSFSNFKNPCPSNTHIQTTTTATTNKDIVFISDADSEFLKHHHEIFLKSSSDGDESIDIVNSEDGRYSLKSLSREDTASVFRKNTSSSYDSSSHNNSRHDRKNSSFLHSKEDDRNGSTRSKNSKLATSPTSSSSRQSRRSSRQSQSPKRRSSPHNHTRVVSKSPRRSNGPNLLDQSESKKEVVVEVAVSESSTSSSSPGKTTSTGTRNSNWITPPSSTKLHERKSLLKASSSTSTTTRGTIPKTSNIKSDYSSHPSNVDIKTSSLSSSSSSSSLLQASTTNIENNNNKPKNKLANTSNNNKDAYRDKAKEYLEHWKRKQLASKEKSKSKSQQTVPNSVHDLMKKVEQQQSRVVELDSDIVEKRLSLDEVQSGGTLHSEKVALDAEIAALKKQLHEKEALLEEQELVMKKERKHHFDTEFELEKLDALTSQQRDIALTSKVDFNRISEEVQMYKEQLQENDEYIAALEKAMDEQLTLWEQEDEKTQLELKSKNDEIMRHDEREKKMQQELLHRKQQVMEMKQTLKETNEVKNSLVVEKKKNKELEVSIKMNEVKTQRINRQLQEKNEYLELELQSLKDQVDESMTLDESKDAEISRLQEEIKHAEFRVQVLKTEVKEGSPRRPRSSGEDGNGDKKSDSISNLELQLELAQKQAKKAVDEKEKAEKHLRLLQLKLEEKENGHWTTNNNQSSSLSSNEIEHLNGEVERLGNLLLLSEREKNEVKEAMGDLEQKLFESRSRSRRIAVKSESEMAEMRVAEKSAIASAEKWEAKMKKLEQQLLELKSNHSVEYNEMKRTETALRRELAILHNDDSKQTPSITSFSTHVEETLEKLSVAMSKLLTTMDEIGSAKRRISKDSIKKMSNEVDLVKVNVATVEAAFEEDKVKLLSSFKSFTSSIQSNQTQMNSLKEKLKQANDSIKVCEDSKSVVVKEFKQTELDLLSKCNILKGKFMELQQEFDAFKAKSDREKTESNELEAWLLEEINALENLCQSHPELRNKVQEKKKLRMSLQHGTLKDDIEVRLKDDNEPSSTFQVSNSNEFVKALRNEVKDLQRLLNESRNEAKQFKEQAKFLREESSALRSERDRERKLRSLSEKLDAEQGKDKNVINVDESTDDGCNTSKNDDLLEKIREESNYSMASEHYDTLMKNDNLLEKIREESNYSMASEHYIISKNDDLLEKIREESNYSMASEHYITSKNDNLLEKIRDGSNDSMESEHSNNDTSSDYWERFQADQTPPSHISEELVNSIAGEFDQATQTSV